MRAGPASADQNVSVISKGIPEICNNKFGSYYNNFFNCRGTLEGISQKPSYEKLLEEPLLRFSGLYSEPCASFMVKCQVYNQGKPLGLAVTSSYKAFTKRWSWNEWITLPLQFSDLPRTAVLCLTIYDCAGPGKNITIGGTTISLFGNHGIFRQGMFDLRVWPNQEADGQHLNNTTPGKGKDSNQNQMQRLAKLAKKHRNGQIHKVDWLDRLTFREIEVINEKEKRESDYLYLMIEFPVIQMEDKIVSNDMGNCRNLLINLIFL